MERINVGIIGTGWCGGIRAETCADSPFVNELHIAETNADRLAEMERLTKPKSATSDYRRLLDNKQIDAIIISATPETTHYPMARAALLAGKHVFLEKPIAQTLEEADELTDIARRNGLKFTIGYSQRFNAKYAYVREKILDGTLGEPVSALVSRHLSRALGKKISSRTRLSPAAMEATHDLDFILWCLEPRKPIRVYAQMVEKVMQRSGINAADCVWIVVTMDDGVCFTIGAGWILPPGYPNFSTTWIEFVGSEGSLFIDDTHRDVVLNTMSDGMRLPMSTMPGERVGHTYAGGMAGETVHFLDAIARDRPVLVTPEQARKVMEVYVAADLSAERHEPVSLPLNATPMSDARRGCGVKRERKEIGLAVVGCGTIGRIRAMLARDYPGIGWIGLCDLNAELGEKLKRDCGADFFTTSFDELLARPEVTATIIATDENNHARPTLAAVERGHALFIEKPLATDARELEQILHAIEAAGVDAVVGYTQRFRRRFLAVKERLITGQIGEVHSVVTRAFMNRMVPIATVRRTNNRANLTPMVVSGTHSLDMSLWLMEGKTPVSVYARSTDRVLSRIGTKDSTFGIFEMDDGAIWSMNISWALPETWPGSVYGLEIGIVGDKGVIDIEDTHRDLVLASEIAQGAGYSPDGFVPGTPRHVDFLTSYPPGDLHMNQLWGPMREETNSWYQRLYTGQATPHATAAEGHRNLLLTMAMDLSARLGRPLSLPVETADLMAA